MVQGRVEWDMVFLLPFFIFAQSSSLSKQNSELLLCGDQGIPLAALTWGMQRQHGEPAEDVKDKEARRPVPGQIASPRAEELQRKV